MLQFSTSIINPPTKQVFEIAGLEARNFAMDGKIATPLGAGQDGRRE